MSKSNKERPQERLPPGQQLVAPHKWPIIGERQPSTIPGTWMLTVGGEVTGPATWTLDQLRQLPETELTTDIHCVTRWSKFDMRFRGVLFAELVKRVDYGPAVRYVSFVAESDRGHSTSLPLDEAIDLGTLLAWEFDGQSLQVEHGGPLRVVVPGRYFYKSLKWLKQIDLLAEDRLGYWEAEAGYHNTADPWKEQRYMAPTVNKQQAAKLLASRDFRDRDLRSIDASQRQLDGLQADGAALRNANFARASLVAARFRQANLSNANFRQANLQRADFTAADLEGADLSGADLSGAVLDQASLFGATLFDPRQPDLVAQIDRTTRLPADWKEKLTPDQIEFVRRQLGTSEG